DGSGGGAWAAAGVVAVAVLGTAIWLSEVEASPARGAAGVRLAEDGVDPVELPAFVGTDWIGRRAEVSAVEREILPADTGFSRRNYVSLAGGAHTVFVSIVLSGRDRTSIHRPELCLVAQGWTIREQTRYSFSLGKSVVVPASLLQTERVDPGSGRRIPAMVAYWFVSSDRVVATHWARFFHDAWNRLRGRADRWAYVLVQADAGDGTEAALERMRAVLEETVPAFQVGQSGGA
ncbi:MAG TPA: EpsI family protein, partial [Opitutus sp.]|nr:EpsI family protein [Opitutus sp.]